jgi:hypothetical protein
LVSYDQSRKANKECKHTSSRLFLLGLLCARRSNRSRSIATGFRLDFLNLGLELTEIALDGIVGGFVTEELGDAIVVDLEQMKVLVQKEKKCLSF